LVFVEAVAGAGLAGEGGTEGGVAVHGAGCGAAFRGHKKGVYVEWERPFFVLLKS